jgi:hypothetical protein
MFAVIKTFYFFKMKLATLFHKFLPFVSFLLFASVLWILKQELNHYKTADILNSISTIPKANVYLAISLTFLGYLIISTIYLGNNNL